jgi:hypothetical protein
MYTTSAFYSQIYVSLLPGRHSSYGGHFLTRYCNPSGLPGDRVKPGPKTEAGPAGLLGSLIWRERVVELKANPVQLFILPA